MSQKTTEFYDNYTERQLNAGIHHRHLAIQRWLEKFNMPKTGNFLEVGCGIGTQTKLMLQYLKPEAKLTAVDISKKSIGIVKQRLKQYDNLSLIAGDIVALNLEGQFDTIILPDVIEHIPVEQHNHLFEKLSSLLNEQGFILIHIPHPNYLEWVTKNKPDELQIIDNPVYTDILLNNVYQHGLYITHLESYSIFNTPSDYQVIVLNKKKQSLYTSIKNPEGDTFFRKAKRKLKFLLRGK